MATVAAKLKLQKIIEKNRYFDTFFYPHSPVFTFISIENQSISIKKALVETRAVTIACEKPKITACVSNILLFTKIGY